MPVLHLAPEIEKLLRFLQGTHDLVQLGGGSEGADVEKKKKHLTLSEKKCSN